MKYNVNNRVYQYYSVDPKYFFGYMLKELFFNGFRANFMIADREKAILDLLYSYDFYKSEKDIEELRLNEIILENEIDWNKMDLYLSRFNIKTLGRKIDLLLKIYRI